MSHLSIRHAPRRSARPLAWGALALCLGSAAIADETKSVVHATLWDKGAAAMGTAMDGPMNQGMAMGGTADPASAVVGITLDTATVKAGEITFEVTNSSKEVVHEMIVAPLKDDKTPLAYVKADQGVDEEAAGALGEVSETDPGKSGSLTLHLKPGSYILFCNVAGHYAMGMWAKFTVTG
jgi:uncharacterized cupredoxin-like copper-binding protein